MLKKHQVHVIALSFVQLSDSANDGKVYHRPSYRVRKKSENYAEIFGNIMRKKVTIMWKRRQIMRKFLQFNNVAPMAFSNI